ncbi:MAG: ABC transporter permease [Clostridiales bacterium]|nr:ABC transporter permease [Clostridiales bacterium]
MKQKNPIVSFFRSREGSLAIFVILCFVVLCLTTNLTGTMFVFLRDLSYLLVGGLALMMVILLGEIDISSGTVLGLIGFCTFTLVQSGVPLILCIVVGILVGMLNSFIIALVTVRFRVPSMIVSLAMVKLHIGLFSLLPNAGYVSNIKASVTALGNIRIAGVIPVMLFLTLALLAFFCWFMKYTRYGRKVYAVGGSRESAILAGINADKITMISFLISGALLGVTGVMYWLPRTQVQPSSCMGMEMFFLPIAVVGGISIAGGSGRPIGILVAGVLIDLLQRAAYLLELGNQWMYLSYGVIVLVAVFSMVVDVDIPFLRWGKKQKTSGGGSDA